MVLTVLENGKTGSRIVGKGPMIGGNSFYIAKIQSFKLWLQSKPFPCFIAHESRSPERLADSPVTDHERAIRIEGIHMLTGGIDLLAVRRIARCVRRSPG